MLKSLSKLFGAKPKEDEITPSSQIRVENVTAVLDPGAPYSHGESVPRWPEQGAALVAASPESLVETQAEVIRRIKGFSPLTPAQFDDLILPVFRRYAEWVHLLPASESHHHYGPGGLLAHGFEVALHAARQADGKQVGIELPPSERAKFQPRWRVAAMLGGLFHDLGKPLVDCGASDTSNTMSWPSMDCSLYSWLVQNKLTHYRIYWRPGPRHERHKAVGTAVVREIMGPELLAWLSADPTQEVLPLMMMSIAQGRTASNLMSVVVSQADSLSVEADLKALAKKTQATGQGGAHSVGALIMAELRRLVETNSVTINKLGGELFHTENGTYGLYPAVIKAAVPGLTKKQITVPPGHLDIVRLLAENGFIESCEGTNPDDKQHADLWEIRIDPAQVPQANGVHDLRAVKFRDSSMVFGNMPLPKEMAGVKAYSPYDPDGKAPVAAPKVLSEPQSVESALGIAPSGGAPEPSEGGGAKSGAAPVEQVDAVKTSTIPAETAPAPTTQGAPEPHIEDRRNRRDLANSRSMEHQIRRERHEGARDVDLAGLIKKVERSGFAGPPIVEVLRRIARRQVVWGKDAFENADGLIVRFPAPFQRLGMPEADLLDHADQMKWLVKDTGSARKVTDRTFPDGSTTKCVIFTGAVLKLWEAIKDEHHQILDGQTAELPGEGMVEPVAPPARPVNGRQNQGNGEAGNQGGTQGQGAPRQRNDGSRPPQQGGASGARNGTPAVQGGQRQPPKQGTPPAAQQQNRQGLSSGGANGAARTPHSSSQSATSGQKSDKPLRPAVGAQPAKGRDTSAGPAQMMSFADKQPAQQAGVVTAGHRTAEAQAASEDYPKSIHDVQCSSLDELNPQKVAWINGVVMRVIGMRLIESGHCVDEFEQLNMPAVLELLRKFFIQQKVNEQAFVKALSTPDNPVVIFEVPDSLSFDEISEVRINPDYEIPSWVFGRINLEVKYKRTQ